MSSLTKIELWNVIVSKKVACKFLIGIHEDYIVILTGAKLKYNHLTSGCFCKYHMDLTRNNFTAVLGVLEKLRLFTDDRIAIRKPRNDKGLHKVLGHEDPKTIESTESINMSGLVCMDNPCISRPTSGHTQIPLPRITPIPNEEVKGDLLESPAMLSAFSKVDEHNPQKIVNFHITPISQEVGPEIQYESQPLQDIHEVNSTQNADSINDFEFTEEISPLTNDEEIQEREGLLPKVKYQYDYPPSQ